MRDMHGFCLVEATRALIREHRDAQLVHLRRRDVFFMLSKVVVEEEELPLWRLCKGVKKKNISVYYLNFVAQKHGYFRASFYNDLKNSITKNI